MSDAEDDLSDEVNEDFDDFDPLAAAEDEEGAEDEEADEEGKEEESEEVEEEEVEPARAKPGRPVDEQLAQSIDTRRIVVVPPEERITSNMMTQAEVTRAIALRAEQMSRYPSAYTDVEGLTQAQDIARKELYDHRSPLVLRRAVGRTAAGERIIEKWPVREMTYPPLN